jgi:4-hydroxybenzoate polyprenyltransferase
MSKVIAFFNLIRFKNLVIIALTQIVIKYSLINYFVIGFVLTDIQFSFLVAATLLITAGGYIINDIYDVETDKINKNGKQILDNHITIKQAMWWYFLFNIIGVTLGAYLAFIVHIPLLSIIFIYSAYSLWTYSKKFKKSLLIGNIQVAFLTALSIINIALFDILPNGIAADNGELMIFTIILYYAGFSALITLVREIIKDIEDYKGDSAINAKTLAIVYGIENAKNVAFILTITAFGFIAYFQYFQYSVISSEFQYEISIWGAHQIAIFYTIFIQLLFIFLAFKIRKANQKSEFYFISQLSKLIMLFGILSIPLFTFLHFY